MLRKTGFFIGVVSILSFSTSALAARSSSNDTGGQVAVIVIFLLAIVGGFIAWACHTPSTVKDIQRRQKERSDNIKSAISEASVNRLGIVILQFSIGHYVTNYYNGVKNTIFAAGPDSANGWTCEISMINSCGKTIKYVDFHTRALNAVRDPATCEVGQYVNNLNATGPIVHGSTGSWHWDHFIYSKDLSTLSLDSVSVEYMDGSKEEFSDDKIVWRTK